MKVSLEIVQHPGKVEPIKTAGLHGIPIDARATDGDHRVNHVVEVLFHKLNSVLNCIDYEHTLAVGRIRELDVLFAHRGRNNQVEISFVGCCAEFDPL